MCCCSVFMASALFSALNISSTGMSVLLELLLVGSTSMLWSRSLVRCLSSCKNRSQIKKTSQNITLWLCSTLTHLGIPGDLHILEQKQKKRSVLKRHETPARFGTTKNVTKYYCARHVWTTTTMISILLITSRRKKNRFAFFRFVDKQRRRRLCAHGEWWRIETEKTTCRSDDGFSDRNLCGARAKDVATNDNTTKIYPAGTLLLPVYPAVLCSRPLNVFNKQCRRRLLFIYYTLLGKTRTCRPPQ